MKNRKGFTLVELLVVLLIIGILAAIATPLYLQNANRARAAEAVATMSLIRQALRDFRINHGRYFDIATGNINEPIPDGTIELDGSCTGCSPGPKGVSLDLGVPQYYSNDAYSVEAQNDDPATAGFEGPPDPTGSNFKSPGPIDFVIRATGDDSDDCSVQPTECAINSDQVEVIDVVMDNSGQIYVTYDDGTTWEPY